ncbi:helix-turn-helix domain-containing protein [Halobacteria archaeon AArc-dxtr1]|nr:helix-turn-helix domain-containing protein [Halobacteria archaeon AArc-dxtr1]
MTAIADLELAAGTAGLGELFDRVPDIRCEMERVVASGERNLWLSGRDRDAVEAALDRSDRIVDWTHLCERDDRRLYSVAFDGETVDIFDQVVDAGGTVLRATATDGSWQLRARFSERERVSDLYESLRAAETRPRIVRLVDLDTAVSSRAGLTPQQHETLVAAIDHGYFEIPRETSMQELSDELGISHQALSERLRRAYRSIVAAELDVTDDRRSTPSMPSD